MKTPNEIIKMIAEKDPIISVRIHGYTKGICYYCGEYQDIKGFVGHHSSCLSLDIEWIALELKRKDELEKQIRETLEKILLGKPLEEFEKENGVEK
jgi:hypothetical protein